MYKGDNSCGLHPYEVHSKVPCAAVDWLEHMKNTEKQNNTKPTKHNWLPAVAMRGLVAFPDMVMHFDIAREQSVAAVNAAMEGDRRIFLVAQKDMLVDDPSENDVYKIGVVAEIRQTLKTPDNVMRVLVEGIYKAKMVALNKDGAFLTADVKRVTVHRRTAIDEVELAAMARSVKDTFERYTTLVPRMPKELIVSILCQDDPYQLFDNLVHNLPLECNDRQQLLEENNILIRLGMIFGFLTREVQILELEQQIQDEVKDSIDKGQREYYLREQMKVISSQLGESEDEQDEVYSYIEKIESLKLDEECTEKLVREAERLLKMPPYTQEAFVIRNYLDTCLELPWNKSTKTKLDIKKAQAQLDKDHYGMNKVKERILESMSVHALMPEVTGQILCMVGPPGVGKTSIGKSIAKALGREYVRVSLGGVKDESDIRGHRKTYVGAMPGRLIHAVKQAKTNNPLILLDEIDKMSNDFKGDPSSAMLEVLDSEQNKTFRDHFIELPFDLSKVLFITTANTTDTIPGPLLDRMELIELGSYTREEKFHIAKNHLIPKQIKKHGLKRTQIRVEDEAIYAVIDGYTKEAGVRTLERRIATLCRKTAKEIVAGNAKRLIFTKDNLEIYLGIPKYLPDETLGHNEVGYVNGLAWTAVGGVLLPIEVLVLDGKGNIELTGSLGDVMKESAKLAVSYARKVSAQYGIEPDFYQKKDMHIHAPEGAVPKDGPSAGVTMLTGVISALSGIPVRSDVAMTGEITLHGKVLPIGGLREKAMAAYKAGMKTIVIPKGNKADVAEVDAIVRDAVTFVYAEEMSEVLAVALESIPAEAVQEAVMSAVARSSNNATTPAVRS